MWNCIFVPLKFQVFICLLFATTTLQIFAESRNFAQNSEEFLQSKNNKTLQSSSSSNKNSIISTASNNDEYVSHLAYPNSGYGNYKSGHEQHEDDHDSATPDEIESSYKQSLVHLKSQNGQQERKRAIFHQNGDDDPLSFHNSLLHTNKPSGLSQSISYQNFESSSFVQPHLPNMQISSEISPFPDVYSTSIPIFPTHHEPPSSPPQISIPIYKGQVENVPISLQQQALALQQNQQKHEIPQLQPQPQTIYTPKDFTVQYPPKIIEDHNGFGSFGAHLKANFRPSEPDLSKFPQNNYHQQTEAREISFHSPVMDTGFSPSFGPTSHNKIIRDQNIYHATPVPQRPDFPSHDHSHNYNHFHQDFPKFDHSDPPNNSEYELIFIKTPVIPTPKVENHNRMAAYLNYLAENSQPEQHQQYHHEIKVDDSDESPSNRVIPEPENTNSFDKLFPTTRKHKNSLKKRRRHKKRNQNRIKSDQKSKRRRKKKQKKYKIALNPSFKGKILPHHWEQLASQLVPSKISKLKSSYSSKNPSTTLSKPGELVSMGEVFRRAYGMGIDIDPNIFGGEHEFGSKTEKFTRSAASTTSKNKNSNDKEDENDNSASEDDLGESDESNSSSSEEENITRKKSTKKRKSSVKQSKRRSKSRNSTKKKEIITTTSTTETPNILTSTTTTTSQPSTTISSSTTTTTPTTTTTTIPLTLKPLNNTTNDNTTTSTSTSSSVHFTISVLPKHKYDHEATSESRKAINTTTTTKPKNITTSKEIKNDSSEYSSSSEEDDYNGDDDSSSSKEMDVLSKENHLQTNGHQKIPLRIADDDNDNNHELIPLYFESSKMPDDFSTAELDDMTMVESGHKKKDLSSEMSKESWEESIGKRGKKRKKIKPSLARELLKGEGGDGKGKKRVQKVKKPKNAQNKNKKHGSSDTNMI